MTTPGVAVWCVLALTTFAGKAAATKFDALLQGWRVVLALGQEGICTFVRLGELGNYSALTLLSGLLGGNTS